MINNVDEMMKKTESLFENSSPKTELSENNKVAISEIAAFSRKTHFYQDTIAESTRFWENIGNPTDPQYILGILALKIAEAPSIIYAICSVIGVMPYLDDVLTGKLETVEGK